MLKNDLDAVSGLTPECVGEDSESGFHEQGVLLSSRQTGTSRPFQSAHERFYRPVSSVMLKEIFEQPEAIEN